MLVQTHCRRAVGWKPRRSSALKLFEAGRQVSRAQRPAGDSRPAIDDCHTEMVIDRLQKVKVVPACKRTLARAAWAEIPRCGAKLAQSRRAIERCDVTKLGIFSKFRGWRRSWQRRYAIRLNPKSSPATAAVIGRLSKNISNLRQHGSVAGILTRIFL